jgi:glycosyltransferase involved in cell wall biosynthesis
MTAGSRIGAGNPIRVHALIDSLTWGGAEMLLADLAAGAPAAGVELSVGYLFQHNDNPAAERLARRDIEPEHVPVRGLLNPASFRSVRRHLEQHRPDLVHTHLEYADTLGGPAARSLGIPTLSTLHVMHWERGLREGSKARLAALARRRCAHRVIAVSDAARHAYLAEGWDSEKHVVTIRNGSAATPEPGAGQAVRQELGLASDDLVVAMLTVLRPGKGHDVAAAAVRSLAERFPGLRLLVAGDGYSRDAVEARIRDLGRAGMMAGHRDDVMALLDACDVLLHPSSFDAFPTGLIEAMAAGVPVLSTRVGGIPEIVEEGETGILVDAPPTVEGVSAALAELLDDPERRRLMGAQGRERYEREFTAEAWAARLSALYREAIRA